MTTPTSAAPILRLAVLSRLLILALILLFRLLFHPYDTSAALNPPCLSSPSRPEAVLWPRIGAAIERSVVWDGVYFVRIAECGYEYEQTYAFMPLLPACMVLLSRSVFAPLVPVIGYRAVLALSGYVLDNVAFVLAVYYLYRLSVLVLKDSTAALRATILFSFNPASIFYSSIMFLADTRRVCMPYSLLEAMHQAYDAIIQKKKASLAVQAVVVGVVRSAFIFIPFIAFQAYGYFNICLGSTSDELSPWCKARIPNLYGYLQSHYWHVGFLKYFQVKQLPNFLLASPILYLSIYSIVEYARYLPRIFQSLVTQDQEEVDGDPYSPGGNLSSVTIFTSKIDTSSKKSQAGHTIRQRKRESNDVSESVRYPKPKDQVALDANQVALDANQGYRSIVVLPFVLHLGFMTFTAFFVMHVQVATRFLSASPSIYWFASYLFASVGKTGERFGYLIWVYFVAYFLLGSLLFSNFYPFT